MTKAMFTAVRKPPKAVAGLALVCFVAATAKAGSAPEPWSPTPDCVAQVLQPRLVGIGELRFVGLRVYEAALWAGPSFSASAPLQHPFALELRYSRRLSGAAIAQRSIDEMRRAGPLPAADEKAWLAAMTRAFPDVSGGDRLCGAYEAGGTVRFFSNGRLTAVVEDAEFARHFFSIWLGEQTSQPALRRQLLALPAHQGS
jgi:hypothetical protein